MTKMICPGCKEVFFGPEGETCPGCGQEYYDFTNEDDLLRSEVKRVTEERRAAGLEGLVGGLVAAVINTEPDRQEAAVAELLGGTGHDLAGAFETDAVRACVLRLEGSADLVVQSRKGATPFEPVDAYPRAKHLPHTRLETFVFETSDIARYVELQRGRGVSFMTDGVVENDDCLFIQTAPSSFTGLSTGLIQWKGAGRSYAPAGARLVCCALSKPARPHLAKIGLLDHCATRVEARDRDPAIVEFMGLTGYSFDFSIYVKMFNSITNVARLAGADYAMVFTSGIHSSANLEKSGPTAKFVRNYGKRVHHMAFRTTDIEDTFAKLKADGMTFLLELVGAEDQGLKQTFSTPSHSTLLVNEYIHRYGDFDGFFTTSNVTKLTGATDRQ